MQNEKAHEIIFMVCYQNWKETMFCGFCCLIISGCVLLFYLLKGFFLIALSFLEVLVHVFDILQFVLFLPWNQRIICHLEGPFGRFAR